IAIEELNKVGLGERVDYKPSQLSGDDGLLGAEERDIITPAIAKAREGRIMAFGPYAADGFFGTAAYTHFDAVLAMYHDQG
ncbi:MAG TPA: 4-hydroxythreonine-4-phosphate dehydrogenase PdxA, partial [Muribaculaceae bacterium]|nr:4-hydroxythreonine-4-phosphate dehydrogenase PdxA [Muribaculaceae bacterium]